SRRPFGSCTRGGNAAEGALPLGPVPRPIRPRGKECTDYTGLVRHRHANCDPCPSAEKAFTSRGPREGERCSFCRSGREGRFCWGTASSSRSYGSTKDGFGWESRRRGKFGSRGAKSCLMGCRGLRRRRKRNRPRQHSDEKEKRR